MKTVRVLRASTWLAHDHSVLSHIVTRQRLGDQNPDPRKPKSFPAGPWRRMSRLARAVAVVCERLLDGGSEGPVPRDIPVVWGSAVGELVPTGRFLDKLFESGSASPLAFQNSVYNAPSGHLSIALGLTGPSETIVAGPATGTAALERGLVLARKHGHCLVVAGDDLSEPLREAHRMNGTEVLLGEAVGALLLHTGEQGPEIELVAGVAPVPGRPVLARQARFPGEPELTAIPGSFAPEESMGLSLSSGVAVLAALVQADRIGGALVEQDLQRLQTARVIFPKNEAPA
jgi:hypothetical protein